MAPPPAVKNFHQHQPITTGLRTICECYPAGTCLRELLQNADDAEATEIEYVLDTNSYLDSPLLYDGLKEYQGPALLARNNSIFRDVDFASLSSVGDSRKRHEASSTGKFGQGFNAVYHWTDGPWVYSRNWLLILDPHERWSVETGQSGGPTWDVVKEQACVEIQNHLKTFQAFHLDVSREIEETIIRIPLRTKAQAKTSKIVEREITIEEIKEALNQFGQEVKEGGLLFLKHIQKVTVRINDEDVWEARILQGCPKNLKARQELHIEFNKMFGRTAGLSAPQYLSRVLDIEVEFTANKIRTVYPYLIHHTMSTSSGDKNLDQWARERKLFPWVAVAAPVKHDKPFMGRLFSSLRLPILTDHPIHLHGLFSITPDRGRLTSSGQSPGSEDFASKWNDFLFASCIASAWADLLVHRSSASWRKERFSLWPTMTNLSIDQWNRLDDVLIDLVIRKNLSVWPTATKCVSIDQAFFSMANPELDRYASALTEVQIPAVGLDQSMFEKLQQRSSAFAQIKWITPKRVRQFLRQENVSTFPSLSLPLSMLLLEYCLLDLYQTPEINSRNQIYAELDGIALWPMLDGQLSAYGEVHLLLPRDITEMKLFASARNERTIDINKLTNQTLAFLSRDVDNPSARFRHRKLADLSEDWPSIYPFIEPRDQSKPWNIRPNGNKENIVSDIWTWICARHKTEGQLPSQLDCLWLLPTSNLRLRRYAPGQGSRPMLIVTEREPLFQLGKNLTAKNPEVAPILDTKMLPVEATMLLQRLVRSTPKLHGACVDHLETFLDWLVACKGLLSTAANEEKQAVLQHIEELTRNRRLTTAEKHSVASQLRSLPIFSNINSHPPFTEWAITKCALQCNTDHNITNSSSILGLNQLYEVPADLPPIPEIPGLSLYDVSNQDERHLVERFDLIKKTNPMALLKNHLLPWVVKVTDGPLVTAKQALIEYAFQHLRDQRAMDILNFPIVPLASDDVRKRRYRCLSGMVDPTSPLAKLYFEHEDVFPCTAFFQRHKETLRPCGISTELDWNKCLDRVQFYSQCEIDVESLEVKAKCLVQQPIRRELSSLESTIVQIRTLTWLPALPVSGSTVTMFSSQKCRGADESDLVDHVLGTTRFSVSKEWRKHLGWEQRIGLDVLLRQLDVCLAKNEHKKADRVLTYLQSHFDSDEYSGLKSKPCVLGARKNYLAPKKIFVSSRLLTRYPMTPYLDEVDSHYSRKHVKLLSGLGVREGPNIQDILDVQAMLKENCKGPLEGADLDVAISSLEIAARLPGSQENADILVPDTESILRNISDIVFGDHNTTSPISEFNFTHPTISNDLIQRLGVEHSLTRATRLEIEFEDEDEDEFTPREKLSTVISDTLGRYPIESTFNEFLANADDCHATSVSWILDECGSGWHKSAELLTSELKQLQGPALFVHNDEVFTEKDFTGFREIGQGGKSDDVDTTGMFGRGALTMYHFTDVPMLISGGFILILDPQQELLPKNRHRKRKIGVKLPLEKARRLWQDQLSPFHGLCNYTKELNHYKGTLFRLPLRAPGKKTTLTDSLLQVDLRTVRTLMEDYFFSAGKSLLFLRNVESIEFSIRGQDSCSWSVSADKSDGSEYEIFRRVKISIVRDNQKPLEEIWRVGLTDIDHCPASIVNPGRGSHKISECGVAACLTRPKIDQRIFCRLPLTYDSLLPISFHASFAITGDRRTIIWEDPQMVTPVATWNRWLLTTCIPDFYVDFLKDMAPKLGSEVFKFWPSTLGLTENSLSGLVAKAFWQKIMDGHRIAYELYPKAASESLPTGSTPMKKRTGGKTRKLHAVSSLNYAQFDLLPEQISAKLRPLLIELCPNLVRPPSRIWCDFEDAGTPQNLTTLTPAFFCRLFGEESNCNILEEFLGALAKREGSHSKSDALEKLLQVVVPAPNADATSLDILDGCRILPKLDGSLGLLTSKAKANTWTFVATEEEEVLFYFASYLIVNMKLFQRPMITSSATLTIRGGVMSTERNPIVDILKASFNIRTLEVEDLGMLLTQPKSPINPSALSADLGPWILKFWSYVNKRFRALSEAKKSAEPRATVQELLTRSDLKDHLIYLCKSNEDWCYITPRQFDDGPYLVQPDNKQQLVLCQEITGLGVVDPACVPYLLAEAEQDLTTNSAFERLVRVLSHLEKETAVPIQDFLSKTLSEASVKSLRSVLLKYLRSGRTIKLQSVLQRLPVWPLFQPSQDHNVSKYLPAEGATFCRSSKLLLPWVVKGMSNLISPEKVDQCSIPLKTLGYQVMRSKEIWDLSQQYHPTTVENVSSTGYYEFVKELADNNIMTSVAIAPNGHQTLCVTSTLYDHEDEVFESAFRLENASRFLHSKMRSKPLHKYWISLGLRSRGPAKVFNFEDYLQCAIAMKKRWQSTEPTQTETFCQDAQKVATYLLYDNPKLRQWPGSTWNEIAKVQMFRVEDNFSDERIYRRDRMIETSLKQDHCSLLGVGRKCDINIAWSQLPLLKWEPTGYVFECLPGRGKPTVAIVFEHLKYMISQCKHIDQEDLKFYIHDIRATYAYLQENSGSAMGIPDIQESKVFFNIDTTEVDGLSAIDLERNLTSAKFLCLNSPVDAGIVKVTRKFLIPYEELLRALGCKSVVQPTIRAPRPSPEATKSPMAASLKEILSLRDQRQLIDVVFEVEGREKPAHRIFLAAVSGYCRAQFSGEWGLLLERQAKIHIEDMSFATLTQMVDFAYTSQIDWPRVQDPGDSEEIAKALDELLDLLWATDMWLLKTLHTMTENEIIENARIYIRPDNVETVRDIALDANASGLANHCGAFIADNASFVAAMKEQEQ